MPSRFAPKTALCVMLAATSCATAAYADSIYNPPYALSSNRDTYQYTNVTTPQSGAPISTAPVPVMQAPEPPRSFLNRYNSELWASAGTSFYNYEEAVTPLPDSEKGFLPSVAAGVDYMTRENLYLSLDGSVSFGDAHYNGALLNSPSTPVQATTSETISTIDGKIGQGISFADNILLTPYADAGYRYWNRNLGSGQIEDYHNFDALGGLMLQVAPIQSIVLTAYGAGGTTFAGRMKGTAASYELGGSAEEKVGGKVGLELTPQVEIFGTLDYDHFHYDHSPVTNNTLEPGSRTSDTTMRAGIGYHFK